MITPSPVLFGKTKKRININYDQIKKDKTPLNKVNAISNRDKSYSQSICATTERDDALSTKISTKSIVDTTGKKVFSKCKKLF